MFELSLLWAGGILVGTVVVGVIAHELSHAIALRLAGVSCSVSVLSGEDGSGGLRPGLRDPLAEVTPTHLPEDLSPWCIRVAAMMPLCLVVPFVLALAGVIPDPFAAGDRTLQLAAVGWLACSIPSPQDFSLLWHPDRALSVARGSDPDVAVE